MQRSHLRRCMWHLILEQRQAAHRSTGKERDSESGNDYFEARYYSSAMGRFMSPDWSAKEEPVPYAKLDDPQTLNLYAYVGNNPMTRLDADGHWSAPFHHSLVQDEFGNLGAHAVQVLDNASDDVDGFTNGGQAAALSYMHSMRDGANNQTVGEAERLAMKYVNTELDSAVKHQISYEQRGGKGLSDRALTNFGHALHTVTDSASPEHRGFQPWYRLVGWDALKHHLKENSSGTSSKPGDVKARNEAHEKAGALWTQYQSMLSDAREKPSAKSDQK